MSSRSSKCPRFFSTRSCSVPLSRSRSWRNSWWKCRRPPLLSHLCRRRSTSWWKCRRSCLSLSGFSRVMMGTCGGSSLGLRGPTGGGWAPLTPSGPPGVVHRQARAEKKYWAGLTMHYKFQQSSPIYSGRYLRFVHRQSVGLRSSWLVVYMPVDVPTTGPGSDSGENCCSAVAFL